jgi:hypothetical protein
LTGYGILTWTREKHPQKQRSPINFAEFGISNFFKEEHSRKHSSGKRSTEHGMLIWTREEHPLKQLPPINVTEFGISNSFKE